VNERVNDDKLIVNLAVARVDMHNSTLANEYSIMLIMYIGSPPTYMNMALWLVDHNNKRQWTIDELSF
jgi:hypothetical protein